MKICLTLCKTTNPNYMKKSLLQLSIIALVSTTTLLKSQVIINPGFETWTNDVLVPSAMNPNAGNATTGWQDFNVFNYSTLGSSPISVTRCSDTVHTGSYSARIQTKVYTPTSWNIYKSYGIPFIGHNYNDTLGILYNGNSNEMTGTYSPGIPCTQKLTQYSFFYQYRPVGTDTAECRVSLVKNRVIVAGGSVKINTPTGTSGWAQAVVNFTYVSSATPDTLWVLFSASSLDRLAKPGSVLWLDDVSVTLPVGINTLVAEENKMVVFPNPSNGTFSIRQPNPNNDAVTVDIYNLLGEKIQATINKRASSFDVDISTNPKGIYIIKLFDGTTFRTEKMILK